MATFLDTSAFYAFLDGDDRFHARAVRAWDDLLGSDRLVTHNYVLLETTALLHTRIGTVAVRDLHDEIVPALDVRWVDEDMHGAAARAVAVSGDGSISMVDRLSFDLMRALVMSRAFTFDRPFAEEGFEVVG